MALINFDPSAVGNTIVTTAAGKAAQAAAQAMSPKLVKDVQRVLKVSSTVGNLVGLKTGINLVDDLLGLTGGNKNAASPLLGGLTLAQAKAIHDQQRALRVAKKNLFFIRITDESLPNEVYPGKSAQSSTGSGGIGGLISSVTKMGAGLVSGVAKTVAASATNALMGKLGISAGGISDGTSVGEIAINCFDMLAVDVSYGSSINADHVQVGSSFIDRPLGTTPNEIQITTMDDEAGSLKRWFEAKQAQIVKTDGTFGLPAEYLLTIEIVHAIPSPEVATVDLAYSKVMRVRTQSINIEHSRRDQAVAELQMQFNQFDAFMGL